MVLGPRGNPRVQKNGRERGEQSKIQKGVRSIDPPNKASPLNTVGIDILNISSKWLLETPYKKPSQLVGCNIVSAQEAFLGP